MNEELEELECKEENDKSGFWDGLAFGIACFLISIGIGACTMMSSAKVSFEHIEYSNK